MVEFSHSLDPQLNLYSIEVRQGVKCLFEKKRDCKMNSSNDESVIQACCEKLQSIWEGIFHK